MFRMPRIFAQPGPNLAEFNNIPINMNRPMYKQETFEFLNYNMK